MELDEEKNEISPLLAYIILFAIYDNNDHNMICTQLKPCNRYISLSYQIIFILQSLNWYDDLQTSDIQLKLKVLFPQGVPPGCLERYIGAVYFVYKYVNNYYYGWKSGILLRIKDVSFKQN